MKLPCKISCTTTRKKIDFVRIVRGKDKKLNQVKNFFLLPITNNQVEIGTKTYFD